MPAEWYSKSTSPTWQLIFAVVSAISVYRASTRGFRSPNQPPLSARYNESSAVIFLLVILPKVISLYVSIATLLHLIQAYYLFYDPDALSDICTHPAPLWLTLVGTIGSSLSWAGTELRVYCYKVLGEYFTFHLAVQEKQPLIKAGPYAYIRHPSYIGSVMQVLGMTLAHVLANPYSTCFGRHTFPHCEQVETALLIVFSSGPLLGILRRMKEEEQMMREKFGKEYVEWEKRTWRMVPFIY